MKAQNRLDSIRYYLKRFIEVKAKGLRPEAIKGRFIGPKILLNSIPKSGTHLLETVVEQIPILRHFGGRTLRTNIYSSPLACYKRVGRLSKGEFAPAHLAFDEALFDIIKQNNIKVLMMARDPRDIIVSNEHYITNIDKTHEHHKYLSSLPSSEARIEALIKGFDNNGIVYPSIAELFASYQKWTQQPEVFCLKFEDLIGEKGGGSQQKQRDTVERLIQYLGVELKADELNSICESTFSTKSSTFRKGKIGSWADSISKRHLEMLHKDAYTIMKSYGYEV
jgi:sulfotransferase 6B1